MIYSLHIFGIHQYPYCRILSRLWLLAGFVWVLAGWVTYFRYPQYDCYQHHHHIFHEFKDQRLEERNSHTKKMLYRTPSPKKITSFSPFRHTPSPPFPIRLLEPLFSQLRALKVVRTIAFILPRK